MALAVRLLEAGVMAAMYVRCGAFPSAAGDSASIMTSALTWHLASVALSSAIACHQSRALLAPLAATGHASSTSAPPPPAMVAPVRPKAD